MLQLKDSLFIHFPEHNSQPHDCFSLHRKMHTHHAVHTECFHFVLRLKSRLSEHQTTCSANTSRCLMDCVGALQEWNLSKPETPSVQVLILFLF